MAQAATLTRTRTGGSTRRHLELYRPGDLHAPSAGRVVTVGRRRDGRSGVRRAAPAVYRRRRLALAGLFLLAIAAVLILAQLIQAGIGGGPLTTTGAAAATGAIPAGTTDYVVRPGDTLWTIAARVDPRGDERPLVDALQHALHGTSLYPGERVPIPARW